VDDTHSTTATNDFATSTSSSKAYSKTDNYANSSTTNDTLALTYMGPTTIGSASAGNIAVNGSAINTTESSALSLAGSAEGGASGVNIVNSVNSMVANGVNIAATMNMNAAPALTQSNVIVQSH
jgi:ribosomal protein S11